MKYYKEDAINQLFMVFNVNNFDEVLRRINIFDFKYIKILIQNF